jgi:hypothetical protein
VRAGASSGFIVTSVFAFAACAIDLSGLQRADAGFNAAIDPDAATAGGGGGAGGNAGTAGTSGTSGAGSGGAGATGKAGTGSAGASDAGAAGRGGTTGIGGAGAGSTAGTTSTGGQSMSAAGMTAPPPAAGAPAAGTPAPEPTDSGPPPRTCGLPGLSCCMPGNMCDVGACLRGKCTPYGGFYALTGACAVNPCVSRNAYTAGCNCPTGFADTLLWQEPGACDEGGSGTTDVRSCTSGRAPDIAFGGAWVQGPDSSCTVGCQTPNPMTGACSCPAMTQQISMTVDFVDATCPSASTTLQVCIDGEGMPVNFGGAYAVSQTAALGCGAANPLTAACSCPDAVTTPQRLHVGSWSIFVCNL